MDLYAALRSGTTFKPSRGNLRVASSRDWFLDSNLVDPRVMPTRDRRLHTGRAKKQTPQPPTPAIFFSPLFPYFPHLCALSVFYPEFSSKKPVQQSTVNGKGAVNDGVESNNSSPRQEEECHCESQVALMRVLQPIFCAFGTSPTPSPHALSSPGHFPLLWHSFTAHDLTGLFDGRYQRKTIFV